MNCAFHFIFQDYIVKSNQEPSSPKDKNSNKREVKQLQEELMSVKIREAGCLSELKETKQKVMEFETQVFTKIGLISVQAQCVAHLDIVR